MPKRKLEPGPLSDSLGLFSDSIQREEAEEYLDAQLAAMPNCKKKRRFAPVAKRRRCFCYLGWIAGRWLIVGQRRPLYLHLSSGVIERFESRFFTVGSNMTVGNHTAGG